MKICASNSEVRQHDAVRQQDARRGVVDRDPDPYRSLTRHAGDRHQPAHALRDLIDAGAALIGPVLAKAGDAAVDGARVDLPDRVVIDTEPVLDGRLEVLDHDIGLLGQFHEDRQPFLALQVQRDRALVAVQVLEIRAVAAAAGRVSLLPRRLDLDHVGTPIGKLAHCRRPGAVRGQVENLEPVERQGRHVWFLQGKRSAMLAAR
jgi:hypothetical protein